MPACRCGRVPKHNRRSSVLLHAATSSPVLRDMDELPSAPHISRLSLSYEITPWFTIGNERWFSVTEPVQHVQEQQPAGTAHHRNVVHVILDMCYVLKEWASAWNCADRVMLQVSLCAGHVRRLSVNKQANPRNQDLPVVFQLAVHRCCARMSVARTKSHKTILNRFIVFAAERGLPFIGLAHKMGKELFPPLFEKHGGPFYINMGPLGGWNLAIKEAEDVYDCLSRYDDFEVCVPGIHPFLVALPLYLCCLDLLHPRNTQLTCEGFTASQLSRTRLKIPASRTEVLVMIMILLVCCEDVLGG